MSTKILLKNGTIVDGTGALSYTGDILIEGDSIKEVSSNPIDINCETLDCSGKVISPGFIDMHSHNDWFMPSAENHNFFSPFLEQGITTFVGGNCGYGAAGFKKDTEHLDLLENNLFKAGHKGISWRSLEEYFQHIEKKAMPQNMAILAGHGTARTSVRGYDASPLKTNEEKEILYLLEESLDNGARGVSFGMGYAPDIFMTFEEQKKVAQLVKRKNGIITSHVKAFSSISGAYPLKPFGTAHNLLALKEMLDLARETGVSMHISHLIFVGQRTWKTLDKAMKMIDGAIAEGLDIHFDTYAHHCGATVITGILPDWFMAQVPEAYNNKKLLKKARNLMKLSFKLLGFNDSDMQVAAANYPEYDQYNGMFIRDIAEKRKEKYFETYINMAKGSDSTARLLMHKYSNRDVILELMKHINCHFMTDAWIEPEGLQNPGAYGSMPRFLQLARETNVISLEETIHKLTGKNAQQAKITDRGFLKKGMAADVVVFDWKEIADNTSIEKSDARPTGIDFVFINGHRVLNNGQALVDENHGKILH